MVRSSLCILLLFSASLVVKAQKSAIMGDWREPGGSVIRIAPCGQNVCADLIKLGPQASSPFDVHNPNPAKRSGRLCGMRIGYDFHLTAPSHAESGLLYDPKSGKTYHGEMTVKGDHLDLRGYVGLPLFGRSEQWTRVSGAQAVCT